MKRALAVLPTAVAALMLIAATPAGAESLGNGEVIDGDHCTLSLDTGDVSCYDTPAEADRAASDWVFKFWGKPNFDGKSFTVTFPTGSCPEVIVYDYEFAKLEGWNNRISSLKARGNCRVKLFAKKDWDGRSTGWLKKEDRLGTVPDPGDNWNNAASSLAFKGV